MPGVGDLDVPVDGRTGTAKRVLFFSFFQGRDHVPCKGRLAPRIVLTKYQQDIARNTLQTILKVAPNSVLSRNERRRPHDRGKGGVASVAECAAPNLVHQFIRKGFSTRVCGVQELFDGVEISDSIKQVPANCFWDDRSRKMSVPTNQLRPPYRGGIQKTEARHEIWPPNSNVSRQVPTNRITNNVYPASSRPIFLRSSKDNRFDEVNNLLAPHVGGVLEILFVLPTAILTILRPAPSLSQIVHAIDGPLRMIRVVTIDAVQQLGDQTVLMKGTDTKSIEQKDGFSGIAIIDVAVVVVAGSGVSNLVSDIVSRFVGPHFRSNLIGSAEARHETKLRDNCKRKNE
mmetsp:Transcript_25019/g.53305  ORF Transcript_25019/g.53305 Transcript_25019/m.53305 type:complete len:344 (-) Transcript_25019:189-1220(-)